jgi:uncharacterized membrane protein YhaH (DUF805 family)
MDFVGAVRAGFQNYVKFRGTATRTEYWYWILFISLVTIVLFAIDLSGIFLLLFSLATFLPSLSVNARRLTDAGFSRLWLLIVLPGVVMFVYGMVVLFNEFIVLGVIDAVVANPEYLDESMMRSLLENGVVFGSSVVVLLGMIVTVITYSVVGVIMPLQRTRPFEHGNKRVAPKGPETPAL